MADQGTKRALEAEEESEEVAATGPRPFWSGTITFGLVSIPVNLFPAVRSAGLRTRLLAPDGTPLQRRYFCPKQEKDVTRDELVRGYELDDGEHVVITDEDLEAIAPRKSRDIDLRRFVDAAELDPFLFERAYVLTPGGESHKAYRLLADVMERENKAGIATFVMREKEYLIAILAEKGILRGETLRFADEVRSPSDVGLPDRGKVTPALVSAFENVIRKAEKSDISRDELSDERTEKLKKLIERKRRENKNVIEAPTSPAEEDQEEAEDGGGGIDLLEAIRRSLRGEGAGEGGRAKPHRARSKPSARKAVASTRARTATPARGRSKKAAKTKRR